MVQLPLFIVQNQGLYLLCKVRKIVQPVDLTYNL